MGDLGFWRLAEADPAHLALARRFRHHWLLDDLAAGRDNLPGKHANTQIPKIVAEAADYEVTGDGYGRRIAETFLIRGSAVPRAWKLWRQYSTNLRSDSSMAYPGQPNAVASTIINTKVAWKNLL